MGAGSLEDANMTNEQRAARNAELRARMARMKGEMDGQLGGVMSRIMSIMGTNAEDLLTDEEIDKILHETFSKFDKDNSGRLEQKEFVKAWEFLELKGSRDEINAAYLKVD